MSQASPCCRQVSRTGGVRWAEMQAGGGICFCAARLENLLADQAVVGRSASSRDLQSEDFDRTWHSRDRLNVSLTDKVTAANEVIGLTGF